MSELILKKAEIAAFLDALAKDHEVWAPARVEGVVDFRPYEPGNLIEEKVRPRLSVKKFFHPQREEMFKYTLDPASEKCNLMEETLPQEKRVVFGVSSCDARAVVLNGLPFCNDPNNQRKDIYYQTRWDNTVLIGWGCDEPCAACFCHATGGHPFGEEGLDLILTDLGEEFLVKVLTDKGRALAGKFQMGEAAEEQKEQAAKVAEKARASMPGGLKMGQPMGQDLMGLYGLTALWEEIGSRCLNCGICTYLCPTCYCFDILDETSGQDGVRFRIWDACMFPLYTLHGTGHNPRSAKPARVRQRFMHKLKYFPDRHEKKLSCVGCGRCVVYCPVNIDIREVASRMKAS